MKKIKYQIILLLVSCFIAFFFISSVSVFSYAEEQENFEEKIYLNCFDGDFDHNKAIVVLDVYHSEPNKELSKNIESI